MTENYSSNGSKANCEVKNIGVKRDSKLISNNFIFRRIQNGLIEGVYEENANLYQNLNSFNWDDERLAKLKANPCNYFIDIVATLLANY